MSTQTINQEKLYKVLLAPVVSEKSSTLSSFNQYVFKVAKDASKNDIARAVKLLFNVDVLGVRTLNTRGKQKVFARNLGRRASWKKAIIQVAQGQMIDATGV